MYWTLIWEDKVGRREADGALSESADVSGASENCTVIGRDSCGGGVDEVDVFSLPGTFRLFLRDRLSGTANEPDLGCGSEDGDTAFGAAADAGVGVTGRLLSRSACD